MKFRVDIETFSSEDIKKSGLYRYAMSPDFDVLLFGCAYDDDPVRVYDCTDPAQKREALRACAKLVNAQLTKTAFNAAFEWFCLSVWLNRNGVMTGLLPIDQWRDTQLAAQYCGYPSSLEGAGQAIGIPEDKKKLTTGKALIRTFCTPRKPTARDQRTRVMPADEPEKWNLFIEYNAGDVVAEREIDHRLEKWPVPDFVQKQWEADTLRNAYGVAVDMALVSGALKISAENMASLLQEAAYITGLENPNSRDQLHKWLTSELPETDIQDLRKETVSGLLAGATSDQVRRVLEIRQETGKAAHKKYGAIQKMVCPDGRLRGLMKFYGANRTGRWCIAEGELVRVKTTSGDVTEKPIESVQKSDLVWDGESWVKHDGVVFKGVKSVISWDGVTATPDHEVWVSPDAKASLAFAAENKIKLWAGY